MPSPPANDARLSLRGHDAVTAAADLSYRTRRVRLTRGMLVLLGCWALAPLAFIVPPHLPWATIALGCGVYFAFKQWRGEYVVHSFTGECPRCHAPLRIEPGAKIRLPHTIDCFQCHHEPVLEATIPRASGEPPGDRGDGGRGRSAVG